jgi:hypothetical protein
VGTYDVQKSVGEAAYTGHQPGSIATSSTSAARRAASALRHDLEIVHRDRDYAMLARVSALRQRAL